MIYSAQAVPLTFLPHPPLYFLVSTMQLPPLVYPLLCSSLGHPYHLGSDSSQGARKVQLCTHPLGSVLRVDSSADLWFTNEETKA